MASFGGVKEKTFSLIEQGEYCLTLSELEETVGRWGDRMIWKFLVAPTDDFANYLCRDDGEEKTVWAFTERDIILGSLGHEFVEKMTGRKFGQDADPPDEDDLLGKRVLAYITHTTPTSGKNAGKKREEIVTGSIKPFKGPSKKIAPNVVHAPVQAEADEEEANRLTLVAEAKRQISKAVKFETPSSSSWAAMDIDDLAADALHMMIRDAKEEIQAALDA